MIYKRCYKCHKRIPAGTTCECMKRREYAPAEGIKKQYHTDRWKELRKLIMSRYNGIDLYALYKYKEIVYADTVHHIEPTSEKPELFYADGNLIPVSDASHKEIHRLYKTSEKRDIQSFLHECLEKYCTGVVKK